MRRPTFTETSEDLRMRLYVHGIHFFSERKAQAAKKKVGLIGESQVSQEGLGGHLGHSKLNELEGDTMVAGKFVGKMFEEMKVD